jgi:hypothetical protein
LIETERGPDTPEWDQQLLEFAYFLLSQLGLQGFTTFIKGQNQNMETPKQPSKQENTLLNIGLNFALPVFIMSKGPKAEWLLGMAHKLDLKPGIAAMVLALVFPISYGIYDFVTRRKYNFFSILGFASVLMTGLMTVLEVPKEWIAWKEAAIPTLLGLAVLASLKTKNPLVRLFIYNDQVMQVKKVNERLRASDNEKGFEMLLRNCTLWLALSFLISAILNFMLAKVFIQSETGTDMFTQEMGKMTFWSYIIIMVPSMAIMIFILYRLIQGIQRMTGLTMEEFLGNEVNSEAAKSE